MAEHRGDNSPWPQIAKPPCGPGLHRIGKIAASVPRPGESVAHHLPKQAKSLPALFSFKQMRNDLRIGFPADATRRRWTLNVARSPFSLRFDSNS